MAGTGELAVDAPAEIELTSINIDSAAGTINHRNARTRTLDRVSILPPHSLIEGNDMSKLSSLAVGLSFHFQREVQADLQ